jgi:hypothetical protein
MPFVGDASSIGDSAFELAVTDFNPLTEGVFSETSGRKISLNLNLASKRQAANLGVTSQR